MMLMAAGVAFYAFLSLVPSLVAAMLLYGLVTEPQQVQQQLSAFSGALPASARDLLDEQLTSLAGANDKGLGIGLVGSVLLSLWSASGGTGNLVTAVNTAYDETQTRGFVKRTAIALGLTVGASLVFVVTLALRCGSRSRRCAGSSSWVWSAARSPSSTGWRPTAGRPG